MIALDEQRSALELQGERLWGLLKYASRAFVLEFAGTPKSGKSTTVEAIRHFFSRQGFRGHVLTERAAVCPIPMKGHLFFNMWCAGTMLAELLANVETETDIIIVDRGILDALVWLTLQAKRGELTPDESKTIEKFLLLDRWRRLIDVAVVMSVSAEHAISREQSQRISPKLGSIMNPEVLRALEQSVDETVAKYDNSFSILKVETTGRNVQESCMELAGELLASLEEFLNPEILVVPRARVEDLARENAFDDAGRSAILECIDKHRQFMRRDDAENSKEYVQVIPCSVLRFEGQVFVFQRRETDPKYLLYGRTTIWQGCHVRRAADVKISALLETALSDRIATSLFLSRSFPTEFLGYCWERGDPHSSRHLGCIYSLQIDNADTATDLKKKEFRKRRGHGLAGEFRSIKELRSEDVDELRLENWSRTILKSPLR